MMMCVTPFGMTVTQLVLDLDTDTTHRGETTKTKTQEKSTMENQLNILYLFFHRHIQYAPGIRDWLITSLS